MDLELPIAERSLLCSGNNLCPQYVQFKVNRRLFFLVYFLCIESFQFYSPEEAITTLAKLADPKIISQKCICYKPDELYGILFVVYTKLIFIRFTIYRPVRDVRVQIYKRELRSIREFTKRLVKYLLNCLTKPHPSIQFIENLSKKIQECIHHLMKFVQPDEERSNKIDMSDTRCPFFDAIPESRNEMLFLKVLRRFAFDVTRDEYAINIIECLQNVLIHYVPRDSLVENEVPRDLLVKAFSLETVLLLQLVMTYTLQQAYRSIKHIAQYVGNIDRYCAQCVLWVEDLMLSKVVRTTKICWGIKRLSGLAMYFLADLEGYENRGPSIETMNFHDPPLISRKMRSKLCLPEERIRRDLCSSEDKCPICRERELFSLSPRQTAVLDGCRHHFYLPCIMVWFKSRRTCPVCRADCGTWTSKESFLRVYQEFQALGAEDVDAFINNRRKLTPMQTMFNFDD